MNKRLLLTLFAACTLAAGAQTLAEDADVSGGVPAVKPNALTVKDASSSTTAAAYIWRQQNALYIYDAALEKAAVVLPAQDDENGEPAGYGKATFTAQYSGDRAYWKYFSATSADEEPAADSLSIADDADKALSITLYDGQLTAAPTLFAVAGTADTSYINADNATAGYDATQCGLAYDGKGQGFSNYNPDISGYSSKDLYTWTLGDGRATLATSYYHVDSLSPKGFAEYYNLEGAPMVLANVKAWIYADETNAPATSDMQVNIYTRSNSEASWRLQASMPCSSLTKYYTKKGVFRGYWAAFDTPAMAETANDSHIALADTALLLDGVTQMLVAIEHPNGDEVNFAPVGALGKTEKYDTGYGFMHYTTIKDGIESDEGYNLFRLDYSSSNKVAIGYWYALGANNTAEAIKEARVVTGIANVEAEAANNAGRKGTFDLQGRRVNQMGKGIYVVDGQKILK